MQSLFELKTKLTVDMSVFEQMKKTHRRSWARTFFPSILLKVGLDT